MDELKVRKILSHITLIFAGMFLVFFLIDRVNPAMEFISSEISKWTLLLFVISAILQTVVSLISIRMTERALISRRVNAQRRARSANSPNYRNL